MPFHFSFLPQRSCASSSKFISSINFVLSPCALLTIFLSSTLIILQFIFRYASFLLVITASMHCKLENEPFCSRKIRRRPLQKLSVDARMQLNVFPLIKISDMPEVLELFHANFFIIPNMLPLWLQAVDYFVQKRFLVDLSILIQKFNNSSAQHKANCVLMNEISYQLIIDPHNDQLPVAELVEHSHQHCRCHGSSPALWPFLCYCTPVA